MKIVLKKIAAAVAVTALTAGAVVLPAASAEALSDTGWPAFAKVKPGK